MEERKTANETKEMKSISRKEEIWCWQDLSWWAVLKEKVKTKFVSQIITPCKEF